MVMNNITKSDLHHPFRQSKGIKKTRGIHEAMPLPWKNNKPDNCIYRKRRSIVMDNERYQRYSGEIMIPIDDYPQDDRVNVIGELHEDYYMALLDCIKTAVNYVY